jgi:hypothetical protein
VLNSNATDGQRAKILEQKNTLLRKLDSWFAIQERYVPGLAILRRQSDGPGEDRPQDIPLWLPSAISGKFPCDHRLYSFEWELQYAQANDALNDLRQNLQLRSHLYQYKDRFSIGQQANTWANATISRVQSYITASASRYRVARKALTSLAVQLNTGDSWKVTMPDLRDEDIRAMTVGEDGESEGRRTLSWIWKRGGALVSESNGDDLHECKGSLHLLLSLGSDPHSQRCKLNGARPELRQSVGPKKSNYL